MNIESKTDYSIYYFLKSILPSFVNVVVGFPENPVGDNPQLQLPTVSIDALDMVDLPYELGSNNIFERFWAIDVFSTNKSQRDDFAYEISTHLKDQTIPVYDYDQGFPPDVYPDQIGYLVISNIDAKPVYVFQDLVQSLYWRTRITFFTKLTEV